VLVFRKLLNKNYNRFSFVETEARKAHREVNDFVEKFCDMMRTNCVQDNLYSKDIVDVTTPNILTTLLPYAVRSHLSRLNYVNKRNLSNRRQKLDSLY
jgi:hypothetical protein